MDGLIGMGGERIKVRDTERRHTFRGGKVMKAMMRMKCRKGGRK